VNANPTRNNANPHDRSAADQHTPDETARGCLVLTLILIALAAISIIAMLLIGSPE
jgi:hypothetical protein